MKKYRVLFIVLGVILAIAVAYFVFFTEAASEDKVEPPTLNSSEQTSTPVEAPDPQASTSNGYFVTYADYEAIPGLYNEGNIVYFFNAKWCPTCKALNTDIEANLSSIPAGTAIVSVDYDQYTDLRRQYGVTIQHTLVLVDKDGNQIKKWSGGNTLDSVLQQI